MSVSRTSTQLYRDCLRLIQHIAGNSAKGVQLRRVIGTEFRKNASVTDPAEIEVSPMTSNV
jgi:hypothetical protein